MKMRHKKEVFTRDEKLLTLLVVTLLIVLALHAVQSSRVIDLWEKAYQKQEETIQRKDATIKELKVANDFLTSQNEMLMYSDEIMADIFGEYPEYPPDKN